MAKDLKLTDVEYGNGITSANVAVKGMFFFSGTGPAGRTCNQCSFAYDAKTKPQRAKCQKVADYANGKAAAFKAETPACKYFQRRTMALFETTYDKFNKGAK